MPSRSKKKETPTFLGFHEPSWIQFLHIPTWLLLVLVLIFLFRIPSFFEPFYYGDEMIYLNMGYAIKHGMTLYRDIHDNKPPLLYFMAALSGNVFWFRALLTAWMMGTTVAFYKLAKHLFSKNIAVVQASVAAFALLTTVPLLEGQIANAENFMIGPVILGFYFLLSRRHTPFWLMISGALFSIGTLFKMPSMFDIGAIIFFWLITTTKTKKDFAMIIRHTVILAAGFLIPILITFLWYSLKGALSDYFVAAFVQNVGYLSSWRPDDVSKPFLVRNAPLLLRSAIVLVGAVLLWVYRKKLSKPFIFATLWLLFALFAATLSERPYPHYLLQAAPAISLLIGMLIALPTIEQSLTVIPLTLVVVAVISFRFWYYPSFSYYHNFMQFVTQQKDKWEYFNYFSQNTKRNYKVAEYLLSTSMPDDSVFVWGDSPTIYALSKRLPTVKYVADYHIKDFANEDDFMKKLSSDPPTFVVILPNASSFGYLHNFVQTNYIYLDQIEGAKVYKILSPELSSKLN